MWTGLHAIQRKPSLSLVRHTCKLSCTKLIRIAIFETKKLRNNANLRRRKKTERRYKDEVSTLLH